MTADRRSRANVWDIDTGEVVRSLEGHSGAINAFALSPDGKIAATAGLDNSVRLWDVNSGQLRKQVLGVPTYGTPALAFSPDGRKLISGGPDAWGRVWDVYDDAKEGRTIGIGANAVALACSQQEETVAFRIV